MAPAPVIRPEPGPKEASPFEVADRRDGGADHAATSAHAVAVPGVGRGRKPVNCGAGAGDDF
jgi:hypothetical protein